MGDGSAIANDTAVRRVRNGRATLALALPLRYRQNWCIALGRMPAQDRLALEVFAQAAESAQAIFDVGMNAGSYLYTAIGHRQPGVPVVGFEPDHRLSESVRLNLQTNGVVNVAVETCAVSATSGTARLHRAQSDQMHSLEESFLEGVGSAIVGHEEVRTVSIDDVVAQRDINLDLVKIDVEGHEQRVVQGASLVLETMRPTLFIELGQASADGHLFQDLLERGYQSWLLAETAIAIGSRTAFLANRPVGFENYLFSHRGKA